MRAPTHCLHETDPTQAIAVRAVARPRASIAIGVPFGSLLVLLILAAARAPAQQKSSEDFGVVVEALQKYFDTQPDYEHGDLILASQIADILSYLADAGTEISDAASIIEKGLPDNSFLARELTSPAGHKFMRSVARSQGGYSRLDRLSSTPRGKQLVRDLVRQPGGDKLIEYLATTNGGRNMGAMIGQGRAGVDLNKPTGRIYTAKDLLAELERQHGRSRRALNKR